MNKIKAMVAYTQTTDFKVAALIVLIVVLLAAMAAGGIYTSLTGR